MSVMDARGFKCQRTILQLHLESIPQIVFQIYLLYRIPWLREHRAQNNFTVEIDLYVIRISVQMAIMHLVFEMINLFLESRTARTTFSDYMVACYNARQGWIPQKDDFYKEYNKEDPKKNIIELDNKAKKFCPCIGFSIDFELTDNSMDYLFQIITEKPRLYGQFDQG